jgi:hypothetical protein
MGINKTGANIQDYETIILIKNKHCPTIIHVFTINLEKLDKDILST